MEGGTNELLQMQDGSTAGVERQGAVGAGGGAVGYSTRWGYREVRRGRSAPVALGHGARLALAIHRQRHPRPQQWLSMSMLAQPLMTRL